jgi:hypothetical protein
MRASVVSLAFAAMLSVGGCSVPSPSSTPTPQPSSTPVFANDEEALEAAEAAYAEYLAVVDTVLGDGGRGQDRLSSVSFGAALSSAEADAQEFVSLGLRSIGSTRIASMDLQQYAGDKEHGAEVTVYVCEDVSEVDLVDSAGESIVEPDRKTLTPFEVRLENPESNAKMLVSDRDLWEGDGICS